MTQAAGANGTGRPAALALGNGGMRPCGAMKSLQFPVKIKRPNAAAAKVIITQYGGPDGELGASMRYLSQRYTMPYRNVAGLLTDIGTEELAHLEMVSAIVYQLTKDLSATRSGGGLRHLFCGPYDRRLAPGCGRHAVQRLCFASKGDAITDLHEDMAAEQKARTTYDNIIRLVDDPDVLAPIRFLREREIVHFQRFGEALETVKDHLDHRNFYAVNPRTLTADQPKDARRPQGLRAPRLSKVNYTIKCNTLGE
ncbi:MAG: manganese catalase family protein [Ruthenibacterium lactatiformans]